MKNLSKIIIFLTILSNIEKIHSNWFSDYFLKKDTKQEENFKTFYFSEIDPSSKENIEIYKKLLKEQDMENFLNRKLRFLYSLAKNNPNLVSPETLEEIITKIQQDYQEVTPNASIQFYPALEQFVLYTNYENKRKKVVFNELEFIAQSYNKKCKDLYTEAEKACKEIMKTAQLECKQLHNSLSQIKKEKLSEFKESPLDSMTSTHVTKHPHHQPVTAKAKDTDDDTKEDTSNIFKDIQEVTNIQKKDLPEMKNIPRL